MKIEYSDKDFWKNYMIDCLGVEQIDKWENYVEIEQIDSENKKYVPFERAHFPTDIETYIKWTQEVHLFLQNK